MCCLPQEAWGRRPRKRSSLGFAASHASMSFHRKPHKFTSELQALCADGEELEDKKVPVEIKRSKVKIQKTLVKGLFSQQCSCILKETGEAFLTTAQRRHEGRLPTPRPGLTPC